jgi:hypothetical protein
LLSDRLVNLSGVVVTDAQASNDAASTFALGSGDKGGEAFKQLALPLGVIRH